MSKYSDTYEIILKDLAFMLSEYQKKRKMQCRKIFEEIKP